MPPLTLEVTSEPRPEEVRALVDGLKRHSAPLAPPRREEPLAVFGRQAGELVAGLYGSTYWGWLHIKYLWVQSGQRGAGLGRKLVESAEEEASRRGCSAVVVDTFSFQALEFYEKLGYRVFGRLDDFPEGAQRYYLYRRLPNDAADA